jgi:chromosomal replication initiation ATPase DnaA
MTEMNYFAIPGLESDLHLLLSRVASVNGYTVEQIKSKDKTAGIVIVRHIFCWYAVRNGYSYPEIARVIGRHRTAVMHSEKVISGFLQVRDKRTIAIIEKIAL